MSESVKHRVVQVQSSVRIPAGSFWEKRVVADTHSYDIDVVMNPNDEYGPVDLVVSKLDAEGTRYEVLRLNLSSANVSDLVSDLQMVAGFADEPAFC